jgi:hypothetical protein
VAGRWDSDVVRRKVCLKFNGARKAREVGLPMGAFGANIDLVERSALYNCTTDRLGWDGMECVGK